jgi:NADH-quinone oxidoreductase subunit J
MTTKPRPISLGRSALPGLVAFALFTIMATVFIGAEFDAAEGYPAGESIVAGIGNSLLGITDGGLVVEGFLVSLILIAIALDAALDGAVLLAERDGGDD